MSLYKITIGIFAIIITSHSHAAFVAVEASADMRSGYNPSITLLPYGTTVSANIQFDILPGTLRASGFSSISGSFTWHDNVLGIQEFIPNNSQLATTHRDGWFGMRFRGDSPIINGISVDSFIILFDIGTNPFTSPGSTTELYNLIINSTVMGLRVGASNGLGVGYGDLDINVSSAINPVPIPGAILLFVSGIFTMLVAGSKKL